MAENKNRMNNEPVFGSLAYDLNTLNWEQLDGNAVRQPQEPLRRPERDIRPQREPRRRPAARPREHASPILVGGVAVLALMVVVLMMGYVKLTQASHDLTAKQSQLQQVQEERVALGVAYEKAFDQAATIQVHGSGVSELVRMYPFGNFRTNMVCKFAILFHKEGHGIG